MVARMFAPIDPNAPATVTPKPAIPIQPVIAPPPILVPPKPLSDKKVTDQTAFLWKYKPVPTDEPDPAPEYVHKTVNFSGGEILSARVRGKKHKHNGTNCDDWYELGTHEGIIFAAVSDGAGSRKLSRIGSRVSCQAAVRHIRKSLDKLPATGTDNNEYIRIVQEAVIQAKQNVEYAYNVKVADDIYSSYLGREPELRDFAATLLVSMIVPVSEGRLVISCQIGDGISALLKTDGEFDKSLTLMGTPDTGEFSGETDFLTSLTTEMLEEKTKAVISGADLFFMMTDGVADDYFPNSTEIRRLYFDLIINGILEGWPVDSEPLSPEEMTIARKLLYEDKLTDSEENILRGIRGKLKFLKSLALSYPWVSKNNLDQSIKIPIQYTSRIVDEGLRKLYRQEDYGLKDLWDHREILTRIRNFPDESITDPSELLALWLDNYTVRSSADDRTLVVVRFSRGTEQ